MKIYVAGHDQALCTQVAEKLATVGCTITSSWLKGEFKPTLSYSETDRRVIADTDANEVRDSDALVLVSSHKRIPGGKFVEAGICLGLNRPVWVLGHRENMLLWHSRVRQFNSLEDLVKFVQSDKCVWDTITG